MQMHEVLFQLNLCFSDSRLCFALVPALSCTRQFGSIDCAKINFSDQEYFASGSGIFVRD